MKLGCLRSIPVLAAFVIASLSLTTVLAARASARSMPLHAGQFVNVSVRFQSQVPLADVSEQTLLSAQQSGRKFMYKMASKECAVLKATIAKTCRLTNLNVSAQIRDQNNPGPIKLFLNGNAQFAITLKDKEFD